MPSDPSRPTLVLGATGMLGNALMAVLPERGVRTIGCGSGDLDITDEAAVRSRLAEQRPSCVINAAAYTDVDGCEQHAERATAVNAKGPGHVAAACREIDALLIHVSTDYVFDGESNRPYRENDAANPISVYGRSKWAGEQAVRTSGCRHLVVRTSWLFGPNGRHFVDAILKRVGAGEPLRVVDDQFGRPTYTPDLACAIVRLRETGCTGTLHYANEGSCSWHEFACEIVAQLGVQRSVEPMPTSALGRPARRPRYSVLDTTRYTKETSAMVPHWKDALRRYLGEQRALLTADPARAH